MKYYASVSFGKDSLAMLFMLIDKGYQLDEVVFYDTGMEFQAIYNTRDAVLPILKNLALNIQNCIRSNLFFGQCLKGRLRKEGPILSIKKDIVGAGEHAGGERVKNFVH